MMISNHNLQAILTVVMITIIVLFVLLPILSQILTIINSALSKFIWNALFLFLASFTLLCGMVAIENNELSSTANATNRRRTARDENQRSRNSDGFGVSGDIHHRSRAEGSNHDVGPNTPETIIQSPHSPSFPAPETSRRISRRSVRRDENVDPAGELDDVRKVTVSPPPVPSEHRLHVKHRKGGKKKQLHSSDSDPFPPPPNINRLDKIGLKSNRLNYSSVASRPPRSIVRDEMKEKSKLKSQIKPLLERNNYHDKDGFVSSASSSQWTPVPPPPLPFKMRPMKFELLAGGLAKVAWSSSSSDGQSVGNQTQHV